MALIVETTNLKRTYILGKGSVNALCGTNLEVEKGNFLAILGSSGRGKSTFLNIIGLGKDERRRKYGITYFLSPEMEENHALFEEILKKR